MSTSGLNRLRLCVRGFDTVVCDGSGSGPGGSPLEIKYFR